MKVVLEKEQIILDMAHIKFLSWFRRKRTIASNDLTPKRKVFQAARAGDAATP